MSSGHFLQGLLDRYGPGVARRLPRPTTALLVALEGKDLVQKPIGLGLALLDQEWIALPEDFRVLSADKKQRLIPSGTFLVSMQRQSFSYALCDCLVWTAPYPVLRGQQIEVKP